MIKGKILFVVDWMNITSDQIKNLIADEDFNTYDWYFYNSIFEKQLKPAIFNRYLENIVAIWYILTNKNKYDYIVIWQQMIGFLYCLFPKIRNKPKIIITTVLYSPSKNYGNPVRLFFLKRALKVADALLYFSEGMANDVKSYFKKFSHKVHYTYIPIAKEIIYSDQFSVTDLLKSSSRSIVFCGGRSDRDFDSVVRAFSNSQIPVVIACPENYHFRDLALITENIKIVREISPSEYYSYVRRAFCAIVPLKDKYSSCGQLLFSYCMDNGIPIIASECYGTTDYIKNLESGILVPIANAQAILDAYNLLVNEPELKNKLVSNAKKVSKKMNFANFFRKVIKIIDGF